MHAQPGGWISIRQHERSAASASKRLQILPHIQREVSDNAKTFRRHRIGDYCVIHA